MSGNETRAVAQAFFDGLASGDVAGAFSAIDPNVEYTLTGTTELSGTYHGLKDVQEKLLGPLSTMLESDLKLTAHEFIVDGDRVAVRASGEAQGKYGPYNNSYCFLLRIGNGKITHLQEFLDTALVETSLSGKKVA
ncbi:MAG: nuclear transport factor 2 family protein [Rhodospirillales bacterium]|nr:nuclear transport factor 2 family protein [Rhodospirillales bacterium]